MNLLENVQAQLKASASVKEAFDSAVPCGYEKKLVIRLSVLSECISEKVDALEKAMIRLHDAKNIIEESDKIRDDILTRMCELRVACDEAETVTARSYWPFPTYGDILFSVQ